MLRILPLFLLPLFAGQAQAQQCARGSLSAQSEICVDTARLRDIARRAAETGDIIVNGRRRDRRCDSYQRETPDHQATRRGVLLAHRLMQENNRRAAFLQQVLHLRGVTPENIPASCLQAIDREDACANWSSMREEMLLVTSDLPQQASYRSLSNLQLFQTRGPGCLQQYQLDFAERQRLNEIDEEDQARQGAQAIGAGATRFATAHTSAPQVNYFADSLNILGRTVNANMSCRGERNLRQSFRDAKQRLRESFRSSRNGVNLLRSSPLLSTFLEILAAGDRGGANDQSCESYMALMSSMQQEMRQLMLNGSPAAVQASVGRLQAKIDAELGKFETRDLITNLDRTCHSMHERLVAKVCPRPDAETPDDEARELRAAYRSVLECPIASERDGENRTARASAGPDVDDDDLNRQYCGPFDEWVRGCNDQCPNLWNRTCSNNEAENNLTRFCSDEGKDFQVCEIFREARQTYGSTTAVLGELSYETPYARLMGRMANLNLSNRTEPSGRRISSSGGGSFGDTLSKATSSVVAPVASTAASVASAIAAQQVSAPTAVNTASPAPATAGALQIEAPVPAVASTTPAASTAAADLQQRIRQLEAQIATTERLSKSVDAAYAAPARPSAVTPSVRTAGRSIASVPADPPVAAAASVARGDRATPAPRAAETVSAVVNAAAPSVGYNVQQSMQQDAREYAEYEGRRQTSSTLPVLAARSVAGVNLETAAGAAQNLLSLPDSPVELTSIADVERYISEQLGDQLEARDGKPFIVQLGGGALWKVEKNGDNLRITPVNREEVNRLKETIAQNRRFILADLKRIAGDSVQR